ncbi:hypothetical protein FLGSB24_05790 [Flavobacterium sp. GSB-24]|nr:hypothetical protein FLGSB24_05790 [Flavobacterium sp. GSB-24]
MFPCKKNKIQGLSFYVTFNEEILVTVTVLFLKSGNSYKLAELVNSNENELFMSYNVF